VMLRVTHPPCYWPLKVCITQVVDLLQGMGMY
jgi:hypothetical protein